MKYAGIEVTKVTTINQPVRVTFCPRVPVRCAASPLLRWGCAHVGACADGDGARGAGSALVVKRRVFTPRTSSHRLSAPSATGAAVGSRGRARRRLLGSGCG